MAKFTYDQELEAKDRVRYAGKLLDNVVDREYVDREQLLINIDKVIEQLENAKEYLEFFRN